MAVMLGMGIHPVTLRVSIRAAERPRRRSHAERLSLYTSLPKPVIPAGNAGIQHREVNLYKINGYDKGYQPCHKQLGFKQAGCKEIGEYYGYNCASQQHNPFYARYPILGLVCPFPPVFPYGDGFL